MNWRETINRKNTLRIKLLLWISITFIFFLLQLNCHPNTEKDILTPEERLWLIQHKDSIRLGPDPHAPPLDFFDEKGNYRGLTSDYIRLIEKKLNFKFSVVRAETWDALLEMGKRKAIDVICAAKKTPDREKYLIFTESFIHIPNIIITRKENKKNLTIESLRGKRVVMVKGYAVYELIKQKYPWLHIETSQNNLAGLLEVSFKEADAMIIDLTMASYLIEKENISNLRVAGDSGIIIDLGFASRKDWPVLNRILEKGLALITQSERDAIFRKWISLGYVHFYKTRNFWIVVCSVTGAIIAIIMMILVWNRSLKNQVRLRTEKLEAINIQLENEINGRRKAEEEKKKLREQLTQAQKMESIGTLAGGIAHDFNNILVPVIGYTEMLLEDVSQDSPLRTSLNEVLKGSLRARDLVKQILAFSRQGTHELKPLKIQHILKEVLELSRSTLPSTIRIKCDIHNECGMVMADLTQIHQVCMNLITNAFHAMENSGGILSVALKKVDITPDNRPVPKLLPGPYINLTIADTGVGMEPATMDRIFDPYFTTKEQGKGTGLGLAVVYGIITTYHGNIVVHSKPGKGTSFDVYLPQLLTADNHKVAIKAVRHPGGNERVLFVDDEEAVSLMVGKMLERFGYEVTTRNSSTDALAAFKAGPDNYDLVITDMTMPNLTGDKLTMELKKIRPEIPVILCTGFSEAVAETRIAGVDKVLMKPIISNELSSAVRDVLDTQKADS